MGMPKKVTPTYRKARKRRNKAAAKSRNGESIKGIGDPIF